MMYDVALRIVKNPEIAEDVVADAFLVLITKINAVIEHEQPVKWLFRVLKNNALMNVVPRATIQLFHWMST